MRTTLSVCLNIAAAIGLGLGAARPATAEWPMDKPVRFIIPAAPGGTTDGLGRIFSARLNETLNAQFLVDNRASASGVLAAEITKSAAADGYTLFVPYHQHTVNAALMKLPYHPVNDFTRLRS
jgi:tripartite-type tricarboxylate transporter receptor subunit TctC